MGSLLERSLDEILDALYANGARQVFAKALAPNDNSKNQPYLARGSLAVLNMLPLGVVREEPGVKRPNFKASLPLSWMTSDGSLERAIGSQLIVYPDYPEVRLSGFLKGTRRGPNSVMTSRSPGRVLLLAPTHDAKVIGVALPAESAAAKDLASRIHSLERDGVLYEVPRGSRRSTRAALLSALGELHRLGWHSPIRLTREGKVPCRGSNCGGCNLEARLGVVANSTSGPDFLGWEVKSHKTTRFDHFGTRAITLMTPAPTGGEYAADWRGFVGKYGYPDKKSEGRTNFSSPHRLGARNRRTGLRFQLSGFDLDHLNISKVDGYLALVSDEGEVAATWDFPSLMMKWNTKHAKAAFVPYMARDVGGTEYCYGDRVQLAEGTDFRLFLQQFALGNVVYDPGIWIAGERDGHARSQFRIPAKFVPQLYDAVSVAEVI